MKKVLIVDDEFLIRFTLEEGLKDRGYETQSAETVKDMFIRVPCFYSPRMRLQTLWPNTAQAVLMLLRRR